MPKPKCPDCGEKLQTKALTDSDQRVYAKWRYCENCDWDERGKFEVTVWDMYGNIVKLARDVNESETFNIREEYADEPGYMVQVEEVYQKSL